MTNGARRDAIGFDMDDEEVREWFVDIGGHVARKDCAFIKTRPTKVHPVGTQSDYYQAYIDACGCTMFVKFVIHGGVLLVTSFKDFDHD